MAIYEVGKLYHPERRSWQEGAQFNLRSGVPELLLFFSRPNFHEILAVKKSDAQFGITKIEDVIFFFYKFGSEIPWSDCPFSINLVPAKERIVPELDTEEGRLVLQIFLVEANSGILKAMRAVTLSPEFSQVLVKLANEQLTGNFDALGYDRQINKIYSDFPDTQSLLRECFVFSTGGA